MKPYFKTINPVIFLFENPDTARLLFDNCIETGPPGVGPTEEGFWIEFNYEFLEDTFSIWEKERGIENLGYQGN